MPALAQQSVIAVVGTGAMGAGIAQVAAAAASARLMAVNGLADLADTSLVIEASVWPTVKTATASRR